MKTIYSSLIAATLSFGCTQVSALTLSGDVSAAFSGSTASLSLYDSSSMDLMSGADIAFIDAYDSSSISVGEGTQVSFLNTYGSSNATVSGGDISWLNFYDNSSAEITFVEDLSWLIVDGSSQIDLYGYGFTYENNHLSGFWENGQAFSFWAVEDAELSSGMFSFTLPDNITLHTVSVPEPGSLALLMFGLAGLSVRKKMK